MPEYRMEYEDFRPLKKGEAGYKEGARRYISPSTGEVIGKGTFQRKAQKVPIPKQPEQKTGKPRKPRSDKGMTRADYKVLKPLLEEVKNRQKRPKRLDKDIGRQRYEKAKEKQLRKQNKERARRGQPEVPYNPQYEPTDPGFYDLYDVIRHPERYDSQRIKEAYDYFYYDEDTGEYEEDFPLGETP